MGVGGQRHAPTALPPGKDPVPIVQESGWAPGQVWNYAENLAPTGIRSPDRPVRSESLYRLGYPSRQHLLSDDIFKNVYVREMLTVSSFTTVNRLTFLRQDLKSTHKNNQQFMKTVFFTSPETADLYYRR